MWLAWMAGAVFVLAPVASVSWAQTDAEKVAELFLCAFGHGPSKSQVDSALSHIAKNQPNKKVAYENIIWALLNTKEFVFNQ